MNLLSDSHPRNRNLPRNHEGKTFGQYLSEKLGYEVQVRRSDRGLGIRAVVVLRVVK